MFSAGVFKHTHSFAQVRTTVSPLHPGRFARHVRSFRPLVLASAKDTDVKLDKSTPESKWKELLSAQEYHVLREKGTEAPGTGEYNKVYVDGLYKCRGCGTPLYKSDTKFNSGCGWPAFYAEIPGAVDRHEDRTFGMVRVEITCTNCGAHLGHVFEGEGFPTPTNQRHCVNSISLKFEPGSEPKSE